MATKIEQLKKDDLQYVFHPCTNLYDRAGSRPMILVGGKGIMVEDIVGNQYEVHAGLAFPPRSHREQGQLLRLRLCRHLWLSRFWRRMMSGSNTSWHGRWHERGGGGRRRLGVYSLLVLFV